MLCNFCKRKCKFVLSLRYILREKIEICAIIRKFRAKLRYSTCVFFSFAQRNKFTVKVEYFLLFLSMLFKNCKKTFLLLAETTSKISQTTLRSYLRIVHRKNVSMVSDESYIFSLQYGILSSNMLQSRSLPLIQN